MTDVQLKYEMLDPFAQKKVDALMELLLTKKNDVQTDDVAYKENLLKVSTWTVKDLKVFEENAKLFNNWQVEE